MLKKFGYSIAILTATFFFAGLFIPDEVLVERSITVNASQERTFKYLSDMKNFNYWSPWYRMEPNANYALTGPVSGVGGKLTWSGKEIGSGSMKLVEVRAPDQLTFELDFGSHGKPISKLDLNAQSPGTTKVVWQFSDNANGDFVKKYMQLIMRMMIQSSYEEGLNNLKVEMEKTISGAS